MLSPKELLETRKKDPAFVPPIGEKLNAGLADVNDLKKLESYLIGREAVLTSTRVKLKSVLLKAIWHDDIKEAEVLVNVGHFLVNKGHVVNSKIHLYPEEAIYLVDIGALELFYNGVPMSVQRAFHVLLNDTGVTLKHYRVYYHLTILGNKVTRFSMDPEIYHVTNKAEVFESSEQLVLGKIPISFDEKDSDAQILKSLRDVGPRQVERDNSLTGDFILTPPHKIKREGSSSNDSIIVRVFSEDDAVPTMMEMSFLNKGNGVPVLYAVVHPDSISFFMNSAVDIPILL